MSSKYANEFISYVNASPSPYHAVQTSKKLLIAAGFTEISERQSWASQVKPGHKYFLTRNGSSLIAFGVGKKWQPGNGVSIVGAHTDSPTLRVKPNSNKKAAGYHQVGVELYGGGLWHTWFDRDLSVAGRVLVHDKETGRYLPKLVKIDKPILRIPTLAIHLDHTVNSKLEFNKETQLFPILGLIEAELNGKDEEKKEDKKDNENVSINSIAKITDRHESSFLKLIAREAGVSIDDIQDFELVLFDTQPSVIGGINDEFIFSPRLDNLNSSYCATQGLVDSLADEDSLDNEEGIRLICLFDHEEVGSASAHGAASNFLSAVLTRLSSLSFDDSVVATPSSLYETYSKSFVISADMAHGVHPNYESKHEGNHRPAINKGPVIKINANQRYSTNSTGTLLVQNIGNIAKVPLQLFVVRNDSSCGSTIGPILASKLGIRTLDIGNPQLSMHSIRETCGTKDVGYSVELFEKFFKNFTALEKQIVIEDTEL